MRETHHLRLADVIAIHERAMRRFGAAPNPLRDEGLLESALMRPRMAAHYEGAVLVRQAAAAIRQRAALTPSTFASRQGVTTYQNRQWC
jgi:prophage maintenance system killer protein